MNVKKSILFLLVFSLLGCNALRPTSPVRSLDTGGTAGSQRVTARPLTGRVDFTALRQTQATPGDVVNAATVSLIDTGTNQTIATGKTDASGAFTINPAGLAPANGNTYLLEAIKGLNAQAPGSSAARFRTTVQWQTTPAIGWLSSTNNTVGGVIVVNALTTALAIEAALDPVNVTDTIGKVDALTSPASLNASPGPYTNHPDSEITQLASDLVSYLGVDTDPIAMVPSILPSVTSFSPQSGPSNALVRIQGSGFSPAPSGNTVTFSGAPAQVLLATPTSLVVAVPANAATGAIQVQTGRGTVTTSTFTVLSSQTTSFAVTGFSPQTGRSETEVTLTGNFPGNPATDATPSVLFAGNVLAPVSAWDPGAGTIVTTVPLGASNGTITVRSGLQNATSLDTFIIQKGDITPMVTLSSTTAGQEDAIYTLPDGVMNHATATWKNPDPTGVSYCYLTGGQNVANTASSAQGIVRLIPLMPDSTIGNYKTVGTLLTPRYLHASLVVGNYLYVIGGCNSAGTPLNTIEMAPINPVDGTLGTFTNVTAMSVARAEIDAVLVGGNTILVPLGITTSAGALATNCEKITVNTANGTVTTGAITMARTLPAALGTLNGWRGYGCDMIGSYLILAGGAATFSATALGASYQYKKIIAWPVAADNSMATNPVNSATDLSWAMCYTNAETVTSGGNTSMWVAGGASAHPTGGSATSGVGYVTMTGATPVWNTSGSSNLTYACANGALLTNGNRLYNVGGYSGASIIASVQSAQILAYNSLNPWGVLGNLIWSRYGQSTVRLGTRIYQIGGVLTNTAKAYKYTEHFQIRPDGTITPSKYEYNLVTARVGAASVVVNNRIYVIGGNNDAVPAVTQNTIERATFNPATNLITTGFAILPGSYLNIPRAYPACAYINGYIYVFGGENGGTKLASIERAYVNADGSLSPWELVTGTILPEARSYCNAVVVADHLYIVAGATTASINTKDTLMATFDAGGLGTFTRGSSLVTSIHSPAVARIGSYLYAFGGSTSATTATKQVQRAPINPDLTLGTWTIYQPGGKDVLPAAVSHFTSPPIIYNNWVLLLSGNDGTGIASVTIAEGSIQ